MDASGGREDPCSRFDPPTPPPSPVVAGPSVFTLVTTGTGNIRHNFIQIFKEVVILEIFQQDIVFPPKISNIDGKKTVTNRIICIHRIL